MSPLAQPICSLHWCHRLAHMCMADAVVSVAEAKEGQEISETARSERNSLQPFVSRPEGDREVDQTSSAITPFSIHVASFAFHFVHHNFEKYGKLFFTWMAPRPALIIMDSDMLKEIFARIKEFKKPRLKALGDVFLYGLLNVEGDKWAKHRKIMDPAVHLEKLKLVVTTTCSSCDEMMRTWEEQVGGEVDVWPHPERLSSDVISRAALGGSYEPGKRIFLLQKELMRLASKASQFVSIPGSRKSRD